MKRLESTGVEAVDPRMFGKDWWSQPLQARYASIDAHQAGLMVRCEKARRASQNDAAVCITWRGTSAQFQATRAFTAGVDAKRSSGKYVSTVQLRGTVYPDGEDRFLFVIEWCCKFMGGPVRRAKRVREAMSDKSYIRFRKCVLDADTKGEVGHGQS